MILDKQTILNNLAKDYSIKEYCNLLCNYRDIANDLYQECFLRLSEIDDEKIIKIYNDGKIRAYATSTIHFLNLARKDKRQILNGNYNPFIELCNELTCLDFDLDNNEEETNTEKFDKVVKLLEKERVSDCIILFESINNNMKQMEKDLGIPYVTIRTKRKRIINKIKENIR